MSDVPTVPMICATSVMKPGRTRIGTLGKNLTLPRTIPIVNLVAALIGAFVGLTFAVFLGNGFNSIAIGVGLGAGAGWMSVTYSPLRNESLAKWFELQFKSQTRSRYINGRRVTVAVGTAVVKAPSSGPVILRRSAVRVPVGHYDERGVVRSAANHNLLAHQSGSHLGVVADAQLAGGVPLPAEESSAVEPTSSRRARRAQPPQPSAAEPTPTPGDAFGGPSRRLQD